MVEDLDRDLFKKCIPFFDKRPVIFDIGAHEGHYTNFVIETIPDAYCYLFEPNIDISRKLYKYKNVFELAISSYNGYKSFYVPPKENDELSSLFKRDVFKQTGYETRVVPCTSLDSFCLLNTISKIDFIKVDVEGGELEVLKGGEYNLANTNIKFMQIEYGGTYRDANITFNEVISFLKDFNYRVYELIENKFVEITEENFIEDYRYTNFISTYLPLGFLTK